MKKTLAILLSALLLIGILSGCGSSGTRLRRCFIHSCVVRTNGTGQIIDHVVRRVIGRGCACSHRAAGGCADGDSRAQGRYGNAFPKRGAALELLLQIAQLTLAAGAGSPALSLEATFAGHKGNIVFFRDPAADILQDPAFLFSTHSDTSAQVID